MDSHKGDDHNEYDRNKPTKMIITPDVTSLMSLETTNDDNIKSNGHSEHSHSSPQGSGPWNWTDEDMDGALDALRNHNMSLTQAASTYCIPSTTLWQRAQRLGIDTPKIVGARKPYTEENLNSALEKLRTGTISANKVSKAYGIPSSTLYKLARREGIQLAAPFNAAPTTWTPEDLEKALESIRTRQTSVQRASTEFGIPTGTLYGQCKRKCIDLTWSYPTPWSEDTMGEALAAVRLGQMSMNQAAIHYNLPYSSLYGRVKRGAKNDSDPTDDKDPTSTRSTTTRMGEALAAVRLGHMTVNQAAIHYNLPYSSLYSRHKRGAQNDSDSTDEKDPTSTSPNRINSMSQVDNTHVQEPEMTNSMTCKPSTSKSRSKRKKR